MQNRAEEDQEGTASMDVISIDPAPGKKSTIFDGQKFLSKSGPELRLYLAETGARNPETLLCWDAPLTGPANPASAETRDGDFTQRLIEKFFMRSQYCFVPPRGISVRPYSGCQHWTITRSLLGLPRTGPYDLPFHQLPFHLQPAPSSEQSDRPSVVEIHPAVAAWLWCRRERRKGTAWEYKKDSGVREELWNIILQKTRFSWDGLPTPRKDDEFDAAVGYLLGSMYLQDRGSTEEDRRVDVLGNRCTGALLLPMGPELKKRWQECKNRKGRLWRRKPKRQS